MAGALSFVGGFFQGLNNAQAAEVEKRMRDQERFGALAMNSIDEYKREITQVRKQHQELNQMGKQLVAAGVEPEKVDYALSLPYSEAIKLMNNPEALRNIEVRRQQAAAQAPGQPQAAPAAPASPQAPAAMPQAAPVQGAAPQAPAGPMPAQAVAPVAPAAPGGVQVAPQTFGMREGTMDPLADMRGSIEQLAKNAGWSPKMMAQFQQALGNNQDMGIYRFANPQTAGQLVFRDPKQLERVATGNRTAMDAVFQTAARLPPNMEAPERIRVLGQAFNNAYQGTVGSMEGAIMPSPEMFQNLVDPTYARQMLENRRRQDEIETQIKAFEAEYIRQGMKPEDARIRAAATARGMGERQATPVDPNPGFNQITAAVAAQFKGDLVPDPMTGGIRVNITDPTLRSEALFATTVAQELYRDALSRSPDGRLGAMSPAQAAQAGMDILNASKSMMNSAVAATPNDRNAARQLLMENLRQEYSKPQPDRNRIRAMEGAITLMSVQAEAQASPPSSPPSRTPAAPSRGQTNTPVAPNAPLPAGSRPAVTVPLQPTQE